MSPRVHRCRYCARRAVSPLRLCRTCWTSATPVRVPGFAFVVFGLSDDPTGPYYLTLGLERVTATGLTPEAWGVLHRRASLAAAGAVSASWGLALGLS